MRTSAMSASNAMPPTACAPTPARDAARHEARADREDVGCEEARREANEKIERQRVERERFAEAFLFAREAGAFERRLADHPQRRGRELRQDVGHVFARRKVEQTAPHGHGRAGQWVGGCRATVRAALRTVREDPPRR